MPARRAFLAACVMQAAALEGLLEAMCLLYPDQVNETVVYQRRSKRGFRRKRNRALDFSYAELINSAAELSWYPPKRVSGWAGGRPSLDLCTGYVICGTMFIPAS